MVVVPLIAATLNGNTAGTPSESRQMTLGSRMIPPCLSRNTPMSAVMMPCEGILRVMLLAGMRPCSSRTLVRHPGRIEFFALPDGCSMTTTPLNSGASSATGNSVIMPVIIRSFPGPS